MAIEQNGVVMKEIEQMINNECDIWKCECVMKKIKIGSVCCFFAPVISINHE